MPALREIFASFGIEFDRSNTLARGERRTVGLEARLRQLGAVVGGGLVVGGIRRFVGNTLRLADDLEKTALQIGLTTRELQAFGHAADLAGVDAAGFSQAMGLLLRRASDAARGEGAAVDAFRNLGIETSTWASELPAGGELLRLVADGLRRTENPAHRAAASMDMMGRSGRRMLPMLMSGRAGLADLEAQLDALGGGVSDEFIRRSVEINDNLTRWRMAFLSLRSALILSFLPMANRAVTATTRWTAALSRNRGVTETITVLVGALGVAAAGAAVRAAAAWVAAGWPILAAAAAIAILYLAAEDLWVAWQGGDSVMRRFINELFPGVVGGLDATDRAIMTVASALSYLIALFDALGAVVAPLGDILAAPLQPLLALAGVIQDIGAGRSIGDIVSRAAGRMTADVLGTGIGGERGALLGYDPEAAARGERRAGLVRGTRQFADLASGTSAYQRHIAGAITPDRLRGRGAGARQAVRVEAPVTVHTVISEAGNPAETERRVREAVREETARQTRQIVATLAPTIHTVAE